MSAPSEHTSDVPITDTDRLDALERFVVREPLVPWDGVGRFPGGSASGLSVGQLAQRTLREALDEFVEADRRRGADHA